MFTDISNISVCMPLIRAARLLKQEHGKALKSVNVATALIQSVSNTAINSNIRRHTLHVYIHYIRHGY